MRDLLYFLPRAYDDYRRCYALAELAALALGTPVVVRGTVVRVHKFFRRMLDVYLEQDGTRLRARWFRPNAGMAEAYARGSEVALAGHLRRTPSGEPELVHPSNVTALVAGAAGAGIRPRYPLVEKVPGRTIEKLVEAALAAVGGDVPELLPEPLRARLGLPGIVEALAAVHRPPVDLRPDELAALVAGRAPAQRRLALEELFVSQVALAQERQGAGAQPGLGCGSDHEPSLRATRAALPFALTSAQERAIVRVLAAMARPAPMQCLLQGDVGSGKTAVAFAAALHVTRAGGQTLLMAPTTVLAEQHHRALGAWAARAGLRVGLLHAALSSGEQRRVLGAAEAGTLDIVVGTHALLEERLRLARLGLCIVDEQHRFGVRQRARLRRRADGENGWKNLAPEGIVPHLLVLSATPIPRTLALTRYGDLDLVTLEGLPPGRKPVVTRLGRGAQARASAYEALRRKVTGGAQAYVICPLISEREDGRPVTSAVATARRLAKQLAPLRVGVMHGQLTAAEQQAAADAFRGGALDVLVATTVVEVGVDVPSAEVIVIENAECFGLAQLHQLRGRVGRGAGQAECHLLTDADDERVLARLGVLVEMSDGFRIAEEDLRGRGAGDVYGTRQAGMPELAFADLEATLAMVETARAEAEALLARDPALTEHAVLASAVAAWTHQTRPIAEEAG